MRGSYCGARKLLKTQSNNSHSRRTRAWGLYLLLGLLLTFFIPDDHIASAHHLVNNHNLACSRYFPCPKALHRRVDFWIDVYSRWTSRDAVLHDSVKPDRVFKVIRGKACGRSGNTQYIKDQKRRLKARLEQLAQRLERGEKITGRQDRHYIAMFPGHSPAQIRRSAHQLRCQTGHKDGFRDALRRWGTYGRIVRQVLKDAGLHQDMQYLPFVESSYNPKAYSRLGAAGIWQIMPRTARVLGLELNATVDERLDPEAASWAAARYLKDSRKTLTIAARAKNARISDYELTPFVITSYNYGINGMRRAINKMGPDFVTVIDGYRTRKFRVAVKNFYTSFLAARHVARNARQIFGSYNSGRSLRYDTVLLDRAVSVDRIKRVFGVSESRLKGLNPALTRFVWHGWRQVPRGYRLRLPRRQGGWSSKVAQLRAMPGESDPGAPSRYTVKQGDTACAIASAFRVGCQDLIDMNRLGPSAMIQVGQSLQLPLKSGVVRTRVGHANPGSYTVGSGDTVCGIAQRFGVVCDDLLAANGLRSTSVLPIGRNLVIPGALAVSGTGSSYTVRSGDTACAVALGHGIPCQTLLAANQLDDRGLIFPGQALRIPPAGTAQDARRKPAAEQLEPLASGTTVRYKVQPGDSPCAIAHRLGLSCRALLADNPLGVGGLIHPGQVLTLHGVPLEVAEALSRSGSVRLLANGSHRVEAGESVCAIAQRAGVPCEKLLAFNGLKMASIIVPGQVLRVPEGGRDSDAVLNRAASDPKKPVQRTKQTEQGSWPSIGVLDQDIEVGVQVTSRDGRKVYRINVEANETLGHYSDWLRLGGIAPIRRLNGMQETKTLEIGDALLLPISNQTQRSDFEQRRQEYHRVLVEEFKEHFEIVKVRRYTARRGDSVWRLARDFDLPLWMITRYNPELRTAMPVIGDDLRIPSIRKRGS